MLTLNIDKIEDAFEAILDLGLNKIHCSVTGVAFGTISDSEIMETLQIELSSDIFMEVDDLVDQWELRHWTLSSRPSPAVRNMNETTLGSMLQTLEDGHLRVAGYLLGRLMYPAPKNQFGISVHAEKLQFLIGIQRVLAKQTPEAVNEVNEYLGLIDSVTGLGEWKRQSKWRNKYAKRLEAMTAVYDEDWSVDSLRELIKELYEDVLEWTATAKNKALHRTIPNRMAQSVPSEAALKRLEKDQSAAFLGAQMREGVIKKTGDEAALSLARWYRDNDQPMPAHLAKKVDEIRRKRGWKVIGNAKANKKTQKKSPDPNSKAAKFAKVNLMALAADILGSSATKKDSV